MEAIFNWDRIKRYEAYQHLAVWINNNKSYGVDEVPNNIRDLYDYFDSLQIIVMPINNHKKGTNVWSVKIIIDKLNINNKMGVYKSRSIAETVGFVMALKLLEDNYKQLVK